MDYLLKLKEGRSPFGYAAYSISRLDKPISALKLKEIKGVDEATEDIIVEILETGMSAYYQELLVGKG